MEGREIALLCSILKYGFFNCNESKLTDAINNPSFNTLFAFYYDAIPWWTYTFPIFGILNALGYYYFNWHDIKQKRRVGIIERNYLVVKEQFHIGKHVILHPFEWSNNTKLIWKLFLKTLLGDVEMIGHVSGNWIKYVGAHPCSEGCGILTANTKCIQCSLDSSLAKRKRVYLLLLMRKRADSVWARIPIDLFKNFVNKYDF